jgi:hypothetical protein
MSRWPSQPLEFIIRWLKKKSTSLIVADFGCGELGYPYSSWNQCREIFSFPAFHYSASNHILIALYRVSIGFEGDAKLAKSVTNKVFSMDLVASDESVIACNMAQVSFIFCTTSADMLLTSRYQCSLHGQFSFFIRHHCRLNRLMLLYSACP